MLKKAPWIKIKITTDSSKVRNIKNILKKNGLHSVCEEASCPNLSECFYNGSVTFMILGNICTRNCSFCNVKHGRPKMFYPDKNEPKRLAKVISDMNLNYVVLTSVNRDDLHDGGAKHFTECIKKIRLNNLSVRIEILVPDFKKSLNKSLKIISRELPDVFNHNIESVPRLYKKIRPGANYYGSLNLLKLFKENHPNLLTKSGLMVGLGETKNEIIKVMKDLRKCNVDILTIGQYLRPSRFHFPVKHYVTLEEFKFMENIAFSMGFTYVSCGPFVRSSYQAKFYKKTNLLNKNTK
ncbi:MAG: lipoyl synthase [Candidatus Westeberhardia cardiocondylae]|nr:lipoyl synthase [Candidatus Westeberhardia cardiocondylae]